MKVTPEIQQLYTSFVWNLLINRLFEKANKKFPTTKSELELSVIQKYYNNISFEKRVRKLYNDCIKIVSKIQKSKDIFFNFVQTEVPLYTSELTDRFFEILRDIVFKNEIPENTLLNDETNKLVANWIKEIEASK